MRQSRGAPRAGSSLQEARSKGRGTPRSLTRGPRGASRQPTAAVPSPRPPGGEVGPAQLSGDRGWRPAALEAGAGPFNRATGQRVQEPLWRPPHTHLSPPHVSRGLSVPLLPQLHPPALPHPLCTAADEVTVGKVYAALMIFDFYKQSKSSRDQTHQAPGGLTQVPAPGFPHGSPCRPLSDGPGNAHRSREGLVREEEDGALQAPGSDLTRLGAVRQPAPGRAGEPPRRGARVPSREREGLRTAPGDATFLSGRAVGGDCWAGASVSRSPLTSAGAQRLRRRPAVMFVPPSTLSGVVWGLSPFEGDAFPHSQTGGGRVGLCLGSCLVCSAHGVRGGSGPEISGFRPTPAPAASTSQSESTRR